LLQRDSEVTCMRSWMASCKCQGKTPFRSIWQRWAVPESDRIPNMLTEVAQVEFLPVGARWLRTIPVLGECWRPSRLLMQPLGVEKPPSTPRRMRLEESGTGQEGRCLQAAPRPTTRMRPRILPQLVTEGETYAPY
jgi:hypothetical protein